jgi:trimeric autotransporter adhesin
MHSVCDGCPLSGPNAAPRSLRASFWFLLLVVFGSVVCQAQVTSGTILGTVKDPSGGAVAGAKVVINNTGTNVRSTATTDEAGNFEVPYLQAGQYSVAIDAAGFQSYIQTGITLNTDFKYRIAVQLQIGQATQSIEVTAGAQVLQTDSSELGDTVTNRTVRALPNINSNPLFYATLEPGVTSVGSFMDPNNVNNGVGGRQNFSSFSVNGSGPLNSNIQMDGAPNTNPNANEINVMPSMDSVAEVHVITNAYSAEYGRAAGGVINFTTKSGANDIHGSLYEDFRNSALNANSFGNNMFGQTASGTPVRPKVPFNTNQFGGTFSGPVWIPKVYDGHNRTFFFVSYEGLRRVLGASTYYTVPTALERTGDFSQTKSLVTINGVQQAVPVNVYLPFPNTTTVTQVGAGQYQLNRQQAIYNGVANVIPPQYLNATSLKLASYFPLPNIVPVNADGTLNYFTNGKTYTRTDQLIIKIDHNISQNQKAFLRWTTDWTLSNPPNIFAGTQPAANSTGPSTQYNPTATVGYTWSISPHDMLEVRANATRTNIALTPVGGFNYDITSLGFAANELSAMPTSTFPRIVSGSWAQMGLGNFAYYYNNTTISSLTPNYTKMVRNWTLKFGGEYQDIRYNYNQPFVASVAYSNMSAGVSQPCAGTGCSAVPANVVNGSAGANFLMGAMDGSIGNGEYATGDPAEAMKNTYLAFYSQNDWKATPNLTVNLGVRWEYQGPLTERYNRISQFNPWANNVTGTAGVYLFSGVNGIGRGQTDQVWNNWAPRIGFAYRLGSKTVIRSAYGISYVMVTGDGSGAQGFGSDGFSAPSYLQVRPGSGTYANLDIVQSPYNNAFSAGGVTANQNPASPLLLGQSVTAIIRSDSATPYVQQWNFTIQRDLPAGMNLQASYVGTKGTHLTVQQAPINQADDIPQSTLQSAINTWVATGVNPLTNLVTNPFYGTITNNTNLKNPTIQQYYLDLPYPAYGGVTRFQDRLGSSNYNALQVTVRRAFQNGLQIQGAYTWSKAIDFGNAYTGQIQSGSSQGALFWDPNNRSLDRSVSPWDQTQRAVIAYVWQLPFGTGKKLLGNVPIAAKALGGWQVAGITTFSAGFPLGITGTGFGRPNLIADPTLPKSDQIIGDGHTAVTLPTGQSYVVPAGYKLMFNPYAFSAPVLTVPQVGNAGATVNVANPYYYGTSPRLFDQLRAPGINNFDMNVSRTFRLTEKMHLDARFDAYNLFNRVQPGVPSVGFGGPNLTTPGSIGMNTSSTFGLLNMQTAQTAVNSNSNTPRYLQIALHLTW